MFRKFSESLPRPFPPQIQDRLLPGWVCIFGVSLVFIFNVSLISCFGMMFEPFIQADAGSTFMNLFQFLSNLTVLTTGFLLKNLSAKSFVMIGNVMVFVGLLLTSFVTTPFQLLFTFPVLIGIGIGMLNPAAFVSVLSCFTEKRILAISIGFAALKLGQTILMPAIVKSCIGNFGYTSTIRIITGLSLFGIIGGSLLAPVKWRSCVTRVRLASDSESRPLITKTISSSTAFLHEVIAGADLDLLCILKYVVLLFGLAITYASSVNLDIILPIFFQSKEFDSIQINDCMFSISISDVIFRVAYPMIHNKVKVSSRNMFLLGLVGLGTIRLIFMNMNMENYELVVILCVALGAFRAITVINQVLVLVDFCEEYCPAKLPGALGLSVVIKAALLYIFSWMYDAMRQLEPTQQMNFCAHIALYVIVIILWVMEDEPPLFLYYENLEESV